MTPEGVLYEREAILESLVSQKKALARAAATYAVQQEQDAAASAAAASEAARAQLDAFHRLNAGGGGAGSVGAGGRAPAGATLMPAFWVPAKTPEATARAEKPSGDTLCPATGKKLRLKDLTAVRFTPAPGGGDGGGGGGSGRFMCPLCSESFTNVSRIVVLKPTGDALGEDCYRRFVEPDGSYGGKRVRPQDVIRLERGGTGFAATSKVEAQTYTLLGVGSGMSDNRGQHAAGRSKFAGMRLG